MMHNQKGYTLIEITAVGVVLAILAVASLKTYQGYQNKMFIKMAATEIIKIKKKLSYEAEQTGDVLWRQYFASKGWSNPQTTGIVPQTAQQISVGYVACGTGLDCLTVTLVNVKKTQLLTEIQNYLNSSLTNCSTTGTDITCIFQES